MTATERIELLKAVADCAPEWMGATAITIARKTVEVSFEGLPTVLDGIGPHVCLLEDTGDMGDALGIIAMLDAMEKEGFIAAVYPDFKVPQGEPLKYYVKLKRYSDGITVLATIHGGETRAEAVARAFVAVFGDKP